MIPKLEKDGIIALSMLDTREQFSEEAEERRQEVLHLFGPPATEILDPGIPFIVSWSDVVMDPIWSGIDPSSTRDYIVIDSVSKDYRHPITIFPSEIPALETVNLRHTEPSGRQNNRRAKVKAARKAAQRNRKGR